MLPRREAQSLLLEDAPIPFMPLYCKAKAMTVGNVETVMRLNKNSCVPTWSLVTSRGRRERERERWHFSPLSQHWRH